LTPEERLWLDAYQAHHKRGRPPQIVQAPAAAPDAAPAAPADAGTFSGVAEPAAAPAAAPAAPPAADPSAGFRVIDFGAPPQSGTALVPAGSGCPIKDCPRCKDIRAIQTCAVTGEPVYPQMSDDGARGIAAGILGIACIVARMFGRAVQPEKSEVEALARAVKEASYRRAGWVGGYDDLAALAFVLGAFALRAHRSPALPAPAPAPKAAP
jgi:hypothetical protein